MTREPGRAGAPRPLHLPLLLLAVLAGLFATHGLGPHDDDHSGGHLPTVLALVANADPRVAPDAHARHHGAEVDTDTARRSQALDKPAEKGGGGPDECLTLLGLLVALAIRTMLAARLRKPLFNLQRVRTRLGLLERPPDPPCLYRLSILRC